jgi:anaerobic selenocysteine-containing dehydrogenase
VLFVQGSNPAVTAPRQRLVLDGLGRDDLYTVVHDQVLTDTALYADVVLPATTHFEADDLAGSYGSFTRQRIAAVIDRVGESRTNDEVGAGLAARLGLDMTRYCTDPDALMKEGLGGGLPAPAGDVEVLHAPGTAVQFRDTFPDFEDRKRGSPRSSGMARCPPTVSSRPGQNSRSRSSRRRRTARSTRCSASSTRPRRACGSIPATPRRAR